MLCAKDNDGIYMVTIKDLHPPAVSLMIIHRNISNVVDTCHTDKIKPDDVILTKKGCQLLCPKERRAGVVHAHTMRMTVFMLMQWADRCYCRI